MAAQNLTEKIFGRPVFSGSGNSSEFFPEPPNLSYLGGQRPDFIPDGHDYDPSLDAENLVKNGVSVPEAMQLQQLRANIHQNAAQQRIDNDARGAMEELKKVDYASPQLANQLVSIFSKYPHARKSKDVAEQVNFFKGLKPEETNLDIETISDPVLYNKAKTEGWSKLPKAEAMRKVASEEHNRKVLADALENGLSAEDLADAYDKDAGIYDPFKSAHRIKQGKYDLSQETDPRVIHAAIAGGWDKMSKVEAARAKAAHQINMGIEDTAEEIGVDPEELAPFKDPNTGVYDIGKVKGHLRQYASKLKTYPTAEIAKYTAKAQEERDALLSDEGKLAYLQQKHGDPKKTDFPKEEWDEAYKVLSAQPTPSQQALESIKAAMGGKQAKKENLQSTDTTEAKPSFNQINDSTISIGGKVYSGTPAQIAAFKAKLSK